MNTRHRLSKTMRELGTNTGYSCGKLLQGQIRHDVCPTIGRKKCETCGWSESVNLAFARYFLCRLHGTRTLETPDLFSLCRHQQLSVGFMHLCSYRCCRSVHRPTLLLLLLSIALSIFRIAGYHPPRDKSLSISMSGESPPSPQEGLNGMDMIVDGWFHERGVLWPGQAMSLKVKKVLDHHRSLYQDVLVFESENHGNVLVLDGVIQVTERDEFAYQEMIAHIPLYAHANPKKVLVIGGGDGGVLREIARHPSVEEIVICELDQGVIDVSKKFLPTLSKGFDDPRVTVHVMDGAVFMEQNQDAFDVIITDSSDPVGPASVLFETPFYNAMHKSLRDGGIVCTQGECMWLHVDLIRPLISNISKTYTHVGYAYTTIPTYPSGQIGFILATKGRGACNKPIRHPSDDVQKQLRYYTSALHEASFVLPAFAQRAILDE